MHRCPESRRRSGHADHLSNVADGLAGLWRLVTISAAEPGLYVIGASCRSFGFCLAHRIGRALHPGGSYCMSVTKFDAGDKSAPEVHEWFLDKNEYQGDQAKHQYDGT